MILDTGCSPVTTLSRCAVALVTVPAVATHRPDALVVWSDAHADLNTPQTTKQTTNQRLPGWHGVERTAGLVGQASARA